MKDIVLNPIWFLAYNVPSSVEGSFDRDKYVTDHGSGLAPPLLADLA